MPTEKEYTDFLQGLRPVAIGLVSCEVALDRASYQRLMKKGGEDRLVRSLRDSYDVANVKADYFDVVARLELEMKDTEQSAAALSIKCEFEAHFHGISDIAEATARRFAEAELRVFMWPYFRQFVTDTTARMSIRPVLIPLALGPNEGQGSRNKRPGRSPKSR